MSQDIGHALWACRKRASRSSRSSPKNSLSRPAAEKYGYSRRHLHRLTARYHQGGLDAVDARSRRPTTQATPRTPGPTTRHRPPAATHQGRPRCRAGHDRLARKRSGTPHPRPPRSDASCTPLAWSSPEPGNDPGPPTAASGPPSPMNAAVRTPPTGGWPMAPTWKS